MDKIKQRISIAEACGYTHVSKNGDIGCKPMVRGLLRIPNYLNDLNAMHEAEDCLPDAYDRYEHFLKEKLGGEWGYATAAQRA